MFRRYWHPVCLSSEVEGPDCDPVEVTLLGEDLVGFKDTDGRLGLLDARCPHRGTALSYGRNEEGGLRCINHGWKFTVTGECVDTPAEPEESTLKSKVCARSYPCEERGGIVWAYMGPPGTSPAFPEFVWTTIPSEYTFVSKWLQESNYYNAIDGATDSHVAILHSFLKDQDRTAARGEQLAPLLFQDQRPVVFTETTDVGLMIATRRSVGGDRYLWRIAQFYFPYFIQMASAGHSNFWVPIDDEHCWNYCVSWRLDRPFAEWEKAQMGTVGIHVRNTIAGTAIPVANRSNRWLQDRTKQRMFNFSGIDQIPLQDAAVQCTMRAPRDGTTIPDRTREHLASSDVGSIETRARMLGAVKAFEDGLSPPGVGDSRGYRRCGAQVILARDESWLEWAKEHLGPDQVPITIGHKWTAPMIM